MSDSLLQYLFEDPGPQPLTVSELNAQIRAEVERRFSSVWVEGEITNFIDHKSSGHWYFTLRDGSSQIKAACYRGTNQRIKFRPENGVSVRVRGRVTVYDVRGEYQINVESLQPVGEGALQLAFEQIRSKLEKEGLLDPSLKRPLPLFPRRIGVITSRSGAALYDILHVLSRRARSIDIVLVPTSVQGETAGLEIARAIKLANDYGNNSSTRIDVLIVGRGGGAVEDLWAFNEEVVARAIRASAIPVISAVGHEINTTISDLVADMQASTPSVAAEIVAQSEMDIEKRIRRAFEDIQQAAELNLITAKNRFQLSAFSLVSESAKRINLVSQRYAAVSRSLSPVHLSSAAGAARNKFENLAKRNEFAAMGITQNKSDRLNILMAKLHALSPLAILGRGFSITENEAGEIIRNSNQVRKGEKLKIRLANGKLNAEVLSTE
jgi:exodeoxyribonuclease VII large subunit